MQPDPRAQVGHEKAFASLIHACRRGTTKVAPYGGVLRSITRFGCRISVVVIRSRGATEVAPYGEGSRFPRLLQGLLHGGDSLALLLGGLGVPRHIAGAGRRQSRQHFAHEHLGLGPRE